MITLSTLLSIFISVLFAIIYASNDAEIVKNRLYTGNTRPLAHNSRLTIRIMFSFWLALFHYLIVINISHMTGIGLLILLFSISFLSFHCVFDIAFNKFSKGYGKKWHYLGMTSNYDRFWNSISKSKPGFYSFLFELAFLILAVTLLFIPQLPVLLINAIVELI